MICYDCQKNLNASEAFEGIKALGQYESIGLKKYFVDPLHIICHKDCFVQGYHKDLLALIDSNFKNICDKLPASSDYLYAPIVCIDCVSQMAILEGIKL